MLERALQLGLYDQLGRLVANAGALKERAVDGVKHKAVALAVTAALGLVALVFVLIALAIGLVAAYVWLAPQFGQLVALAIIGGSCAGLAAILLIVVALRGSGAAPKPAAARSNASRSGNPITDAAVAVADDALDTAADAVRKNPREAVLGAMAVAVVLGFVIGRR